MVKTAADYSQLGDLMYAVPVIGLTLSLLTIALLRMERLRNDSISMQCSW